MAWNSLGRKGITGVGSLPPRGVWPLGRGHRSQNSLAFL